MKYHPDFENLSMLGIGTTRFWHGEDAGLCACIEEAVSNCGLTVLDTAEMYGNGASEKALGKVIRAMRREELFLVDKIHPDHASEKMFHQCLRDSLARLSTSYLDLYLLHWREDADLSFIVPAMEQARQEGLIRYWGVSNFDTEDMKDLLAIPNGGNCFCNQILYNVYERGAEFELLPYMKQNRILPMSYSSLGSDLEPHPDIHRNAAVRKFCKECGYEPETLMLRMNVDMGFCALFQTGSVNHLRANLRDVPEAVAEAFRAIIDREFPSPDHKYPLAKI